jgi:hypothetical protein
MLTLWLLVNCSPIDTASHPSRLNLEQHFCEKLRSCKVSFIQYQQIKTDFIKLPLYESTVLSVVSKAYSVYFNLSLMMYSTR